MSGMIWSDGWWVQNDDGTMTPWNPATTPPEGVVMPDSGITQGASYLGGQRHSAVIPSWATNMTPVFNQKDPWGYTDAGVLNGFFTDGQYIYKDASTGSNVGLPQGTFDPAVGAYRIAPISSAQQISNFMISKNPGGSGGDFVTNFIDKAVSNPLTYAGLGLGLVGATGGLAGFGGGSAGLSGADSLLANNLIDPVTGLNAAQAINPAFTSAVTPAAFDAASGAGSLADFAQTPATGQLPPTTPPPPAAVPPAPTSPSFLDQITNRITNPTGGDLLNAGRTLAGLAGSGSPAPTGGTGGNSMSGIFNADGSINWDNLISGVGPAAIGALTANTMNNQQNQLLGMGAPARDAMNNMIANPDTWYNSGPAKGAAIAASNALSSKVGNVANNPGATAQLAANQLGGYNQSLSTLANAGNIGLGKYDANSAAQTLGASLTGGLASLFPSAATQSTTAANQTQAGLNQSYNQYLQSLMNQGALSNIPNGGSTDMTGFTTPQNNYFGTTTPQSQIPGVSGNPYGLNPSDPYGISSQVPGLGNNDPYGLNSLV